ncbi:hypothetical protein EJ110_NYTH10775 [Nymphaea thermarum]|nr:hypothetical protein EJ110_NYTH10775 [Nymphaea thermarum]
MGSLEEPESRRSERWAPAKRSSFPKSRSKMERSLRFEKIDYLQWICSILVFLSVVILFQAYLPTSVTEKSGERRSIAGLRQLGDLSFGEEVKFVPGKVIQRLERDKKKMGLEGGEMRPRIRTPIRRPRIAIVGVDFMASLAAPAVFADMLMDDVQLLMFTLSSSLQEIGYAIQLNDPSGEEVRLGAKRILSCEYFGNFECTVDGSDSDRPQLFAVEDGPVHSIWSNKGISVSILQGSNKSGAAVDWLNTCTSFIMCFLIIKLYFQCFHNVLIHLFHAWCSFDGLLINSLQARGVLSKSVFGQNSMSLGNIFHICNSLMQEPFKSIPVIWTIHEWALPHQLTEEATDESSKLINEWKQAFARATVVIFPDYVLPMMYAAFDSGNYMVVPGSSVESWEASMFKALNRGRDVRAEMGYTDEDFVIVIVGSQLLYSGIWLEHSLIMKALVPLLAQLHNGNSSDSRLKIAIVSGNSTSTYKVSLQAIALKLGYPRANVQHFGSDEDVSSLLSISDLVIYGTFREEQSFPSFLTRAMCLGKPIVAPDLEMITKHIDDRVNGFLFPKENIGLLTEALFQAVSNGKLSLLAQTVALNGKKNATNLMVSETIEGYATVLETIVQLPSEVAYPKSIKEIPQTMKDEWHWHIASEVDPKHWKRRPKNSKFSVLVGEFQNYSYILSSTVPKHAIDEVFSLADWEEQRSIEMAYAIKRREEEELKDRTDQPRGTWEEVYRNAKRADRARNELHERDDRELERIGQPLCIYEPYFGEGAWPFLHQSSLYRGIGLSTKGRRPGADDIDGSARLPLLNSGYYRDVLSEYGAFFALANRIDRLHRNAWIGSQSWRAAAKGVSLSETAERAVLEAIQSHKHGDALYFWARLDDDSRNPAKLGFWSFCDAVNAGNCRFAVSEALKRMYGVSKDFDALPPMPDGTGTWSVMHSWALPTRSFLEMVMFARMFVDALDAELYDEHHRTLQCYLSTKKDRHCYSRLLELVVNIWAYHSARRMIYVNPQTGAMQEQHGFAIRRGKMWIRWFTFSTLKSMDEELAEESDSDHPNRRWLWPLTGEVFWQGIYERERNMRNQQKAQRKQKSKDKIRRIKNRQHQKTLGKYIKPPPEEVANTTVT